ncbi:MAG TPA: TonB-dependent receptor [Saprospiraceae bacterium]|nr:TonB-dependent receptor [Saprospiraceae bacterium]
MMSVSFCPHCNCPKALRPFGQLLFTAVRSVGLLSVLYGLVPQRLAAQQDTLPEALVRDIVFEKTGFATWKADSLPLGNALALSDRLLFDNPLFVRANAPGTLATLSARGLGPSHTPVFWQGFNLQSPQNGVVDAALIPVWRNDQVAVRYGGQSAALSNGAMGGAVLIESGAMLSASPGWSGHIDVSGGSFGRVETGLDLSCSGQGFRTETRMLWQRSDNDFPFDNTALIGMPHVRQANNAMERTDIQHFTQMAIGARHLVGWSVWYQRANRQIPPAMTEAASQNWQRDRSFRAVGQWQTNVSASQRWEHRIAWFDETIYFRQAGDVDSSRARSLAWRSEYVARLRGDWKLRAGAAATLQWAAADGYTDTARWYRETRPAAYGLVEKSFGGFKASFLLRQEWQERRAVPLTWSAGLEWGPIRAHFSRNYLLPTFNDRFWLRLGQSDLRSESGYSADFGGRFWEKGGLRAEASVYSAWIDDLILWQPGNDGVFRPSNARKVWSRGGAATLNWKRRWRKNLLSFQGTWQYSLVTNTAVYAGEKAVLGKQLTYVPRHLSSAGVQYRFRALQVAYLHQWTGARFVTTDNAASLKAYQTGSLLALYRLGLGKRQALEFNFQYLNCWGAAYQLIAYRPMPGRNWKAGCSWTF